MSAVLWHQAHADLRVRWKNSYMMPNALKLPESIEENAIEAKWTKAETQFIFDAKTLVISISSGTVAAGVLNGWIPLGQATDDQPEVVLHLGYSRPEASVREYIRKHAPQAAKVRLIDMGYAYKDRVESGCPFPCNPYYDLKAWRWLMMNPREVQHPVLFWNIGA
jgi:hypothetical protein